MSAQKDCSQDEMQARTEYTTLQMIMTHRVSRFLCGIWRAHELGSLIFTKPNPGGTGADNLPLHRKVKDQLPS